MLSARELLGHGAYQRVKGALKVNKVYVEKLSDL